MTTAELITRLRQYGTDGHLLFNPLANHAADALQIQVKEISAYKLRLAEIEALAKSCYDPTHKTAASTDRMAFVLGQIMAISTGI